MQSIMEEIKTGLRYMFQTKSNYVCCISGTGVCPPPTPLRTCWCIALTMSLSHIRWR